MISEKRDENWSTGLQDDLKRMQKKKVNQKKGKSWWCEVIGKFHMQIQHCIRTILFAATSLQYPPLSGPHQQLNFPTFISIMVEYNTNRALQDVAEWEKEQNLNWMKILGSLVEKWLDCWRLWQMDCCSWLVEELKFSHHQAIPFQLPQILKHWPEKCDRFFTLVSVS